MLLTKKKYDLNAELKDFSQSAYEKYHDELMKHVNDSAASKNGAVVRAAIVAGFLVGIEADSIKDMNPGLVVWLVGKVHDHVQEVTKPVSDDPNS